ncbi:sugar phosphate isomerase/epimerase [Actinoplanes sp. LDG1-06]|uniref:Sugar phosphate isomerase/epimerase n=1 Tax=Paractinoplanes ovalisporus TaxID=2810368 RepID=A0ABS2AFL5_9ACTN|nr:sugar phosphate isomerase/epimerase family protein [Actinoplanes ovalisporus]MBM2618611.1 sugar phosphate isomerase/epimerase [Actinoplanes ovalisporus]
MNLSLGIFARTFVRDTPAEVAGAVGAAGYRLAHWNFAAIGLPTLTFDIDRFGEVHRSFDAAGIGIPSVSGTFNVIHPDVELRERQTAEAVRLIGLVPLLGADVVTLCTGTRDPENMWRAHPGNTDPDAWTDLRKTLDPLLEAAESAGVRLGVEPEPGNVIRDAPTAARLLAELGDDAPVGIVLDPANLLTPQTVSRQNEILGEAVDLLGDRVVGAQAKDVVTAGYSAAGAGLMNYPAVLAQLNRIAPVPLIVQDASEADAPRVRADLLRWAAQ